MDTEEIEEIIGSTARIFFFIIIILGSLILITVFAQFLLHLWFGK